MVLSGTEPTVPLQLQKRIDSLTQTVDKYKEKVIAYFLYYVTIRLCVIRRKQGYT